MTASVQRRTGPTMNVRLMPEPHDPAYPYRVWWVPQVPMPPFMVECADLPTAASLTHVLAGYDLFQYENRVKPDYSNAGGVVVWDDEEAGWVDVDDEDVADALLPADTAPADTTEGDQP